MSFTKIIIPPLAFSSRLANRFSASVSIMGFLVIMDGSYMSLNCIQIESYKQVQPQNFSPAASRFRDTPSHSTSRGCFLPEFHNLSVDASKFCFDTFYQLLTPLYNIIISIRFHCIKFLLQAHECILIAVYRSIAFCVGQLRFFSGCLWIKLQFRREGECLKNVMETNTDVFNSRERFSLSIGVV